MNAEKVAVVVAVDGTARSEGAVRYAVEESDARGTQLRIVHVGPGYVPMTPFLPYLPSDVEAEGLAILSSAERQVRRMAPQLEVATELRTGSRAAGITAAAAGADLLVVGRETRGAVERLISGATTAKVAARAACPVVVVPAAWESPEERGRVVVGVKSPTHAEAMLAGAFEIASARDASLVVVHAWQLPDPYADLIEQRGHADEWIARGEQMLDDLLTELRLRYPQTSVEVRVRHAAAADALVAAGKDADLLLLFRRPERRTPISHLGGTARRVLALSSCPVEVLSIPSLPDEAAELVLEESGQLLK